MRANGPRATRPRERLLDAGPASLSDAELFALFLRSGVCRADGRRSSRASCSRASDRCAACSTRRLRGLARLRGIGPAQAAQLLAVIGNVPARARGEMRAIAR